MNTKPMISDSPLTIEEVMNALPDSWKNAPRFINPNTVKLTKGAVLILIEIDDTSVSVLICVGENNFSKSKTITIPRESFANNESREFISELIPLVDDWNKSVTEIDRRNSELKEVFNGIISMAKNAGVRVIRKQQENSFRFRIGDDSHDGEISENSEGKYSMVLNKLSNEDVEKILMILSVKE